MSATFLAAAARRLAVTTAPFQPAACDPRVAAYAECRVHRGLQARPSLRLGTRLWHPELETDEQRADALNDEGAARVALRGSTRRRRCAG